MISKTRLSSSLVIFLLLAALPAVAADWPQLRGPQRDGHSTETALHLDWSESAPPELWRHSIGEGYSAVSAVGNRLYTAYGDDTAQSEGEEAADEESMGKEYAVALDAATGEEIWKVELGTKTFNEFGHGPRSTPTVDGDLVVYLGGEGRLLALDRNTGEQRWSVELGEDFGSTRPRFGHSTSALIEGDLVILDAGGSGEHQAHVALNRGTGELVWASGESSPRGPGYSSILPVELDGDLQLVHLANSHLRAMDAMGKEEWSFEIPQGEAHSMPIFVAPNRLYTSGATPVGAVMVEVSKAEDGYSVEEVWSSHLVRNHFSTSVYKDGYVYGFDNATLKCVDAETGKQQWAKRGLGKGSLIAANGSLIVLSDRGELLTAPINPEAFVPSDSVQALTGKSWTAPSLAAGILYVRNHSEIVAYDLRQEGAGS